MTSKLCLYFAGVFLSYILQMAAGYAACWLLVRLFPSPRQRFILWMSFLLTAGVCWVSLVYRGFRVLAAPALLADTTPANAPAITSGFALPLGWSHPIQLGTEALGLVYVLVVLVLMGGLLRRHLRLRSFLRNGVAASDELAGLFDDTRFARGVSRCDLLVLPELVSPATAGWWRPRILLPFVCEELGPGPQVEDALSHELLHVARHDYLWASLADFICRLLFFHPVAWFAREFVRLEGELSCDLAMVETRPERCADYADSLTFFARLRMLDEKTPMGIDFAGSASSLGRRVRFILDAPQRRFRLKRVSRTMLGLAIVGAFAVVSPALTILLDFVHPAPDGVKPQAAGTAVPPHPRRSSQPNPTTVQNMASVPRQTSVPETPVYRMSSTSRQSAAEPAEDFRSSWPESSSPSVRPPSFPNVVRDTVGSIVLGRGGNRGGGGSRGGGGGRGEGGDDRGERHIISSQ